jgi:hypothetical protein
MARKVAWESGPRNCRALTQVNRPYCGKPCRDLHISQLDFRPLRSTADPLRRHPMQRGGAHGTLRRSIVMRTLWLNPMTFLVAAVTLAAVMVVFLIWLFYKAYGLRGAQWTMIAILATLVVMLEAARHL